MDGDSGGGAGLEVDVLTDNHDGWNRAQVRRCIALFVADFAPLDHESDRAEGAVTKLCVVRVEDFHYNQDRE